MNSSLIIDEIQFKVIVLAFFQIFFHKLNGAEGRLKYDWLWRSIENETDGKWVALFVKLGL